MKPKRTEEQTRNFNEMHADMVKNFQDSVLTGIEDMGRMVAEEWVFDPAWQRISMNRFDGKPVEMSLYLINWNDRELANIRSTFDEFLDESQGCYIEEGWAEDFIEDLELLKSKIQERINRLNKEMDKE